MGIDVHRRWASSSAFEVRVGCAGRWWGGAMVVMWRCSVNVNVNVLDGFCVIFISRVFFYLKLEPHTQLEFLSSLLLPSTLCCCCPLLWCCHCCWLWTLVVSSRATSCVLSPVAATNSCHMVRAQPQGYISMHFMLLFSPTCYCKYNCIN